jgi:hypothetical protein
VYDSWRVCSEYILDFSGAAYGTYFTRTEVEEAYVVFLEIEVKIMVHSSNKWMRWRRIPWERASQRALRVGVVGS